MRWKSMVVSGKPRTLRNQDRTLRVEIKRDQRGQVCACIPILNLGQSFDGEVVERHAVFPGDVYCAPYIQDGKRFAIQVTNNSGRIEFNPSATRELRDG